MILFPVNPLTKVLLKILDFFGGNLKSNSETYSVDPSWPLFETE